VQTFDNPGAFAAHLERILAGLPEAEEAALRAAGGFLLDAARGGRARGLRCSGPVARNSD
jgi:hypothetical protein